VAACCTEAWSTGEAIALAKHRVTHCEAPPTPPKTCPPPRARSRRDPPIGRLQRSEASSLAIASRGARPFAKIAARGTRKDANHRRRAHSPGRCRRGPRRAGLAQTSPSAGAQRAGGKRERRIAGSTFGGSDLRARQHAGQRQKASMDPFGIFERNKRHPDEGLAKVVRPLTRGGDRAPQSTQRSRMGVGPKQTALRQKG
jgi:hypothetical protein